MRKFGPPPGRKDCKPKKWRQRKQRACGLLPGRWTYPVRSKSLCKREGLTASPPTVRRRWRMNITAGEEVGYSILDIGIFGYCLLLIAHCSLPIDSGMNFLE